MVDALQRNKAVLRNIRSTCRSHSIEKPTRISDGLFIRTLLKTLGLEGKPHAHTYLARTLEGIIQSESSVLAVWKCRVVQVGQGLGKNALRQQDIDGRRLVTKTKVGAQLSCAAKVPELVEDVVLVKQVDDVEVKSKCLAFTHLDLVRDVEVSLRESLSSTLVTTLNRNREVYLVEVNKRGLWRSRLSGREERELG